MINQPALLLLTNPIEHRGLVRSEFTYLNLTDLCSASDWYRYSCVEYIIVNCLGHVVVFYRTPCPTLPKSTSRGSNEIGCHCGPRCDTALERCGMTMNLDVKNVKRSVLKTTNLIKPWNSTWGIISSPLLARSGEILKTQSIAAMLMKIELSAKNIPGQILRPNPNAMVEGSSWGSSFLSLPFWSRKRSGRKDIGSGKTFWSCSMDLRNGAFSTLRVRV